MLQVERLEQAGEVQTVVEMVDQRLEAGNGGGLLAMLQQHLAKAAVGAGVVLLGQLQLTKVEEVGLQGRVGRPQGHQLAQHLQPLGGLAGGRVQRQQGAQGTAVVGIGLEMGVQEASLRSRLRRGKAGEDLRHQQAPRRAVSLRQAFQLRQQRLPCGGSS